jgi:hypothetical protein
MKTVITFCLLIHLNQKNQKSKHTKSKVFFSQNSTSKLPFLTQEAQTKKYYFFAFLTTRSYPRLLRKHVQEVLQKLTAWIGKEMLFSLVPSRKEAAYSMSKKKQVYCHNF